MDNALFYLPPHPGLLPLIGSVEVSESNPAKLLIVKYTSGFDSDTELVPDSSVAVRPKANLQADSFLKSLRMKE